MGFFSWSCLSCGRSATSVGPSWSREVVVLTPDGDRVSGRYDGYGRVDGAAGELELLDAEPFSLYHRLCWERAGRPGFTAASPDARDQGYFFDDADYPIS
jgi:hypothetical protein